MVSSDGASIRHNDMIKKGLVCRRYEEQPYLVGEFICE
jgi:hypothetical protein